MHATSGKIKNVLIEARLRKDQNVKTEFAQNKNVINGLEDFKLDCKSNVSLNECVTVKVEEFDNGERCVIHFTDLKPGSVIAFRWEIDRHSETFQVARAVQKLERALTE